MKKMIKNLMLVAVAAMTFVACSQEGDEINVSVKKTIIEFTAEINEETRSSFGEKVDGAYPSFWSGDESVFFYATDNYGYVDSMTISDDKKLASFTVVFDTELNAGDIIYAYSGESWTGDEAANKTVSIENSQNSTETSVNDRNHYLFAEYTVGEEGVTAPISLSFKHGAAYGKMQLTQFNGSEISEVKITIDENTYTVEPQSLENPTIWFACYEDTNIETFSVEAKVNGIKYGKTIDMASKANPLTFTTGTVSSFKVEGLEEVPADYEVTLSSYTINTDNSDRKVWNFSNEAGDYLSIPFNPNLSDELPAGNYTVVDMCYQFSNEYALEYSRYDTSYNLTAEPYDYARWAEDVAVNISRDEHNMLDFTAYVTGSINGFKKTTKFTYKEVYTEIVEFDGTIKSWTYTGTTYPTYYQIAGDNFSFEIGFYRDRENYIDYRDGGYSLGDASTIARYFAIRNFVVDGNSLTVSAGTVITNTAGGAGELHDIDITLTANGNDYDFSYYGYINGVAEDNSGSEEPEQPELTAIATPAEISAEATSDSAVTVTWSDVDNESGYIITVGTSVKEVGADVTTCEFTGLVANTTYDVSVVAKGDGTTYSDSTAITTTVKTNEGTNTGGNDESVLVSCKYNGTYERLLNHFQLKSSSGNTVINLLFSEYYTNATTIYAQTYYSDSAINTYRATKGTEVCVNGIAHTIDGVSVSGNQSGSIVNVSKSGSTYTITITLSLSNGETKEYTFVGALS